MHDPKKSPTDADSFDPVAILKDLQKSLMGNAKKLTENPKSPDQVSSREEANSKFGPPDAGHIRDVLIPVMLQTAVGPPQGIGPLSMRAYLDDLLKEPESKIRLEQVLVQQIALAHLMAFSFLSQVPNCDIRALEVYSNHAIKFMGEVRKLTEALMKVRDPPAPPNITVAATQQVTVTATPETQRTENVADKCEDRSKPGASDAREDRLQKIFGKDGGRPAKPEVARTPD